MSTYTREEHFNRLKLACDELKSALCDIFQNDIPVDSLMITDYQNNIEKKLNNIRDVYIPAQMFLHSIKTKNHSELVIIVVVELKLIIHMYTVIILEMIYLLVQNAILKNY